LLLFSDIIIAQRSDAFEVGGIFIICLLQIYC